MQHPTLIKLQVTLGPCQNKYRKGCIRTLGIHTIQYLSLGVVNVSAEPRTTHTYTVYIYIYTYIYIILHISIYTEKYLYIYIYTHTQNSQRKSQKGMGIVSLVQRAFTGSVRASSCSTQPSKLEGSTCWSK